MEFTLRCNWLKCHKDLNDQAVVTTCSHNFCIDCSNHFQLSSQREGHRPACPVCNTHLTKPDDVILTNLNPTEDYKTSVLSGLSPNIIMECAGRALSFWAYQATQEIVYQEHLSKNLTGKYGTLNTQMDKIINDANAELSDLRTKLSNMALDQENLKRKNEEITQAYRERCRMQLQSQEMYDKLKRRTMLGQVRNAASDAVDNTIQASAMANRFDDRLGNQNSRPPPPPLFSNMQSHDIRQSIMNPATMASQNINTHTGRDEGTWTGNNNRRFIQNQPMQTPSSHRQRLSTVHGPSHPGPNHPQTNNIAGTPMLGQRATSHRSPLRNLSSNANNGFAGYGMSAGLKVSNPTETGADGFARPAIRSRVAQRPGSSTNLFSNRDVYY